MTTENEYDSGFREAKVDEVKRLLDDGYEIVDVRED